MGRRLQRLEPDPDTAPHVRWIFIQRLERKSLASIARALNDQRVPCPSGADPHRNPHRAGHAWAVPTVSSILTNPRYTGRQVWNRQHTYRTPDEDDSALQLWGRPQQWVISKQDTHPALVSETDFVAVHTIRARRSTSDGSARSYLLAGLVQCGLCQRRMDSHRVNNRPGYRCRHGHTSTRHRPPPRQPKNLYTREDHLLAQITTDIPHTDQPEALAQYLRDHGLIIIYNKKGSVVITDRA
ncbi:recombinase family protein [Saccharopolyspora taberi]|uniref:Recombinase domain-containing protein n=1 Tax=Saccharopolyspora taberi TaxID=60895 RepID=A0ABN3VHU3_9PSEU